MGLKKLESDVKALEQKISELQSETSHLEAETSELTNKRNRLLYQSEVEGEKNGELSKVSKKIGENNNRLSDLALLIPQAISKKEKLQAEIESRRKADMAKKANQKAREILKLMVTYLDYYEKASYHASELIKLDNEYKQLAKDCDSGDLLGSPLPNHVRGKMFDGELCHFSAKRDKTLIHSKKLLEELKQRYKV